MSMPFLSRYTENAAITANALPSVENVVALPSTSSTSSLLSR
jgi:hypothetical protein